MIDNIRVRGFQSIVDSGTLDLGLVTVIVGPSNSGKSALLRALRILCHNATGPGFVTTGLKSSVIEASVEDCVVTLNRGKGISEYMIRHQDAALPDKFTKCGTTVPYDISKHLNLPDLTEGLTFSTQFDKPYLLDLGGTQVAHVLGQLTNADILYAAQREANRRHLAKNQELKIRRSDLDNAMNLLRSDTYTSLPAAVERLRDAEAALLGLATEARVLADAETLSAELASVRANLEYYQTQLPKESPLPDGHVEKLREYAIHISEAETAYAHLLDARAAIVRLAAQVEAADAELAELPSRESLLAEAGTCPTCHQSTKDLAHAAHT